MKIEIANRLIELRKKSGLSQEQLADKLGLSRQSVSKWERAESNPDTDNLICLAKIYNVSLDELLNTEMSVDEIVNSQKKDSKGEKDEHTIYNENGDVVHIGKDGIHVIEKGGDSVHIDRTGIHVNDKEYDKEHFNIKCSKALRTAEAVVNSGTTILSTIAYLILGFVYDMWAIGWIIFFIIPIAASIFECIKHKRVTSFAYPILVVGLYCFIGLRYKMWHPHWVMFLSIPLFYAIISPIEKAIKHKSDDAIIVEDDDDEKEDDD